MFGLEKSAKRNLLLFSKDPNSPKLNNHALSREWEGWRSIDITADFRAVFEITQIRNERVVYFLALGTHAELFSQKTASSKRKVN